MTQEQKTELEMTLDKTTLHSMIYALIEICHEKAAHIRETWQDEPLAKTWESDAKKLNRVADGLTN